ncbi:MAG: hypothetical protein WA987_07450 [Cellvibrio sp.]
MYKLSHGVALLALMGSLTAHAEQTATDQQWTWPCTPPDQAPAPSASQEDFDRYSWQLFIALNRPAKSAQRGQPDCDQPIDARQPSVWQTYKTIDQLFLPDAADPGPWEKGGPDTRLSLINIPVLKNTGVIGFVDQAVGGWLIDQRGNPTYYSIHTNQVAYDYVVKQKLYNAEVVSQAQEIRFPETAATVKASWRVLTKQDDASRYLTMEAQVETFDDKGQPTGKTTAATLGLTGLHIATKAKGYPQWVWSTFEHLDNVPPKENVDGRWVDKPAKGVFYSYFNEKASAMNLNHAACLWQQRDNQLVCVPKEGVTITTPDPLNRVLPLAAETQKVNAVAQRNLTQTVFRHYQLVATQRASIPDHAEDPLGQPVPALAANVTMESYTQATSSCMGCHAMATLAKSDTKSDFSFLFKSAQKPMGKDKK